jgi:hypothetical protein
MRRGNKRIGTKVGIITAHDGACFVCLQLNTTYILIK